ncbi:MAG: type II secretion system F family protein [Anaerolineae bacterium]|nr:type II secretion system F family protein [Phycisphaerae bacterium]
MIIPILVAFSVALFVFLAVQLVATLTDREKRKLKQRLSVENRDNSTGGQNRSITLQQQNMGVLGGFNLVQKLGRRLTQAYPDASIDRFLMLMAGVAISAGGITFLISANGVAGFIAGAVAAYVPVIFINMKRAKRQRMLGDQLPEALDFLSRILRAGHSLSTGLQMMSEELPQPLANEFRRAYDQHSLGQTMEDCLKDMSTRIESTDFAFFVTAVLIQRQTGGDLSEVLGNISGMIRGRMRLQNHTKAKTAEGRFTGYILTAFPAVMFVVSYSLNPSYASVLLHGKGLMLLGVAFGFQMMGLYCIKKITTIRV